MQQTTLLNLNKELDLNTMQPAASYSDEIALSPNQILEGIGDPQKFNNDVANNAVSSSYFMVTDIVQKTLNVASIYQLQDT